MILTVCMGYGKQVKGLQLETLFGVFCSNLVEKNSGSGSVEGKVGGWGE